LAVPPEMVLEEEDPEDDEEKADCLTGAGWGLKAGACWKFP